MFLCLSSVVQDTAHRGTADVKTAGDFGFANAAAEQFADLVGMQGSSNGSAQTFAVLPRMGKSSTNTLAQNLAFELGKDGQQPGLISLL